jgi:hypothetical protein
MLPKHIEYVKVLKRIHQNSSCMSVAEIKLKLANLGVKTKLRNIHKMTGSWTSFPTY